MHRNLASYLSCLLPLLVVNAAISDDNWPRFRGADATGVAHDDPRLPETWSTTDNVKWVADVAGWGLASPIVWGDKVFLTTVTSEGEYEKPKAGLYLGRGRSEPPKGTHHWLVYCFDLNTGEVVWKQEAHAGQPSVGRHPKSTYASETPVTDGERVYALFGDVGLFCYSLDGQPLWQHEIDAKKTFFDYGAAASPVVHEGQVIYVYDNQEASYVASLDAKTGAERWRTVRDEASTWATPYVWQNELRTELVLPGKRKIRSYDLGGDVLWELNGRMSNLVIPSPFAAHGMLYVASGYIGDKHRPVYAFRPGAAGDITRANGDPADSKYVEWYQPLASPYNPSPIVYGDYYYTLLDRGFLTCHDAKTGKEVYGKKRLGGSYTSSPWAYNGKLFCLSEDGETRVVAAGPEFKLLHRNPLDDLALASPAVAQGKLLIRTASKLYCLTTE